MAVARLFRVTLEAPREEVGVLLARTIEFGAFHPARREGMVQDIETLLLGSDAHATYARATDLLESGGIDRATVKKEKSTEVETFRAHDVRGLLNQLDEYLDIIERNLSIFTEERDVAGVTGVLLAVQEASLAVFEDLQRIMVYPPPPPSSSSSSDGGGVRFEGFVPAGSVEAFRSSMGRYLVSAEAVKTRGTDVAYIPTLLVNSRVVSAFESLTLQRGIPKYGEVDPTPILAFVFPFFFGVMFADVGHGAALLALGLFLAYRTRYRSWGSLVLTLSLSTTAFGLVRGSFFGVAFPSPLEHLLRLPPELRAGFTLSSIPFLLEVSVVIGTFHLASGYAIAFVNEARAGEYLDALLDKLPTVALYSFLVPFGFAVAGSGLSPGALFTSAAPTPVFDEVLGVKIPVAVTASVSLPVTLAALGVLVVGPFLEEGASSRSWTRAVRALGEGAVGALAKPFEFFVNTLSYIRLGVLLITTTLLGSLITGVVSAGALGLLVAAVLNVAVISLEGLIVYVQDMRLQLYEWLSKFYSGTGTPFLPLVSSRGTHFRVVLV